MEPIVQVIRRSTDLYLRLSGFQSRFVETPPARIHALEVQGRGGLPPVVLFHGLGSRSTDLLPLIRALQPDVRKILAPDLPGHGRSGTPAPVEGTRPVRESMFAAMDALLHEPAVLFGSSLGGLVAIRYALARPERVLGLFLANPGGAPITDDELIALLSRFRFRDRADAERFIAELTAEPHPLRGLFAWGLYRRMSRRGTRQLIDRIDRTDLLSPGELQAVRAPTLFFWGRQDRILPDSNRRFFLENLPPGARILQPDGYGHAPFLDRPREFLHTLTGFLRSVAQDPE